MTITFGSEYSCVCPSPVFACPDVPNGAAHLHCVGCATALMAQPEAGEHEGQIVTSGYEGGKRCASCTECYLCDKCRALNPKCPHCVHYDNVKR